VGKGGWLPQVNPTEIIPSPWAAPKNQPEATVVSSDEPSEFIKVNREQLT